MADQNGIPLPDPETQEMLREFVDEAFDSLDTNEPIVEDLRNEDNEESVNSIFRVFHTLKGLSGFFEMAIINRVTHESETLLDVMRKQNKPQSEDTITVIFSTFDFLRDLLQRVATEYSDQSGAEEAENVILVVKDCLSKVSGEESASPPPPSTSEPIVEATPEPEPEPEPPVVQQTAEEIDDLDSIVSGDMFEQYLTNSLELIDLADKNLLELETNPDNDQLVGETFGALHSLKGNSGFMGFKEIEEISMDAETILDSIRSHELAIDQNIITILLSFIETIRNRLGTIEAEQTDESESAPEQTPAAVAPPAPPPAPEPKAQEVPKAIEPTIVEEAVPEPPKPAVAAASKPKPKKTTFKKMKQVQRKDIRVETVKIDKLFDLVGELITIETMVTNNADLKGMELPNFSKSANMLNKITRDLQEISMSIRMMPLDGLFNKMKRLVRDVSMKMNKKVEFQVSGQETEMDKNVIDEISDPLVHILRNAIDHGVETPDIRLEHGKTETGLVKLSARYEGNEILILVEDNGAGIDRNIILGIAEKRGLPLNDPENMSDTDVFGLIFEPGFSTAKVVTDISGRGVGMDVVRKNIEKLRGRVTIDSVLGEGSTFTLRIPLTLAILEAMLLRIGHSTYAIPLLSARESFRPNMDNITITMDGLEVVTVREEILPIIRLHDILQVEPDSRDLEKGILIIIESRKSKVCLFVDEIIGQQQAVIKNLTDYIGKVPGLTGCMILGDGGIGLILDIESVIAMTQRTESLVPAQM